MKTRKDRYRKVRRARRKLLIEGLAAIARWWEGFSAGVVELMSQLAAKFNEFMAPIAEAIRRAEEQHVLEA